MGKETYEMKEMKEKVGKRRDPSGGKLARDFTKEERVRYGEQMRMYRSRYGLTDGFRLDKKGFDEYLKKRREMDEKGRGCR